MGRIPLDLYHEVTTSSGARYKWDANQAPGSRLTNFSFRTKIGEGFSDANGQLARRIDQDYPDLNLIDSFVSTGADGSIAYEGRNSAMPRDLGDRHSIGITLAGWMALAKDRKFTEIYDDRQLGGWQDAPLARRLVNALASIPQGRIPVSIRNGGIEWAPPNAALTTGERTELVYDAGVGHAISRVEYQGRRVGAFTNFEAPTLFTSDTADFSGTVDSTALTLNDTPQTATGFTPRRYAMIRVAVSANVTPAAGHLQTFSVLSVFGNSGVPLVASGSFNGVTASAAIKNIAARYCPLLDTSGVQDTSYAIEQCAFIDRTFPYDAWLELNKYHLWHLGVWDNRQLVFRPYDLTDYDWEIRTDDPGTTFSPQGPSTDSLFNGIAVTYTDLLTGLPNTITPETDSTVADTSPENPWNQHGIQHWDELSLSSPTSSTAAALLGQAALADRNRPKTPGTITVRGYVRDRAGNQQPAWKVRAGDTIATTNFPNDTPRLIVETDYNDEAKQVSLSIDKPFALLDAYLDRQANALQAAGLA